MVNLEDISQCEIANRDSSQNLAKETACIEEAATKTESAASDRYDTEEDTTCLVEPYEGAQDFKTQQISQLQEAKDQNIEAAQFKSNDDSE